MSTFFTYLLQDRRILSYVGFPSVNPPSSRFLYFLQNVPIIAGYSWRDLIEYRFICPFRVPSPASSLKSDSHFPPCGAEQHIPSIVPSLAILSCTQTVCDLTLPLSFSQGIFFFQRNTIPFLREFLEARNNVFLHLYKNIITLLKWKK